MAVPMPRNTANEKVVNTAVVFCSLTNCAQKLETVTSFKYLGSIVSDEGSKPEMLSRIAQTIAALTRLKPAWNDRGISLSSRIRLMDYMPLKRKPLKRVPFE